MAADTAVQTAKPTRNEKPAAPEQLLQLVRWQPRLIYSFWMTLITNIPLYWAMTTKDLAPHWALMMAFPALINAIFAAITVITCERAIDKHSIHVLNAGLVIWPCLSWIVLLQINYKAVTHLRKHGVKTGFWRGAYQSSAKGSLPAAEVRQDLQE
jgi:hypothetical protein